MTELQIHILLIALNTIVCATIFMTCWMRIVKMDHRTARGVRFVTTLLAVSALAVAWSPFVPEWDVVLSWQQLLLQSAFLAVQAVTGKLWSKGVPKAFQTGSHAALRN